MPCAVPEARLTKIKTFQSDFLFDGLVRHVEDPAPRLSPLPGAVKVGEATLALAGEQQVRLPLEPLKHAAWQGCARWE